MRLTRTPHASQRLQRRSTIATFRATMPATAKSLVDLRSLANSVTGLPTNFCLNKALHRQHKLCAGFVIVQMASALLPSCEFEWLCSTLETKILPSPRLPVCALQNSRTIFSTSYRQTISNLTLGVVHHIIRWSVLGESKLCSSTAANIGYAHAAHGAHAAHCLLSGAGTVEGALILSCFLRRFTTIKIQFLLSNQP